MAAKPTSPKGAAPAATKTPKKAAAKPAPAGKTEAPASKPATKTAPTVTAKHLSADFGERHSLPKKQAETMVTEMFEMVVERLKAGDRVRIAGLGILEVKSRPARMGRNPATGEAIQIKASKKVAFRAAKELKEAV